MSYTKIELDELDEDGDKQEMGRKEYLVEVRDRRRYIQVDTPAYTLSFYEATKCIRIA